MNQYDEYAEVDENIRVVQIDKFRYKIVREAFGTGLWSIETEGGPLPVFFRDKRYTSHRYALEDIKTYIAKAPERARIYSKSKKDD